MLYALILECRDLIFLSLHSIRVWCSSLLTSITKLILYPYPYSCYEQSGRPGLSVGSHYLMLLSARSQRCRRSRRHFDYCHARLSFRILTPVPSNQVAPSCFMRDPACLPLSNAACSVQTAGCLRRPVSSPMRKAHRYTFDSSLRLHV